MKSKRSIPGLLLALLSLAAGLAGGARGQSVPSAAGEIRGGNLAIEAFGDGSYALRSTAIHGDVLRAEVEVDTAAGTLESSLYPHHANSISPFADELGSGQLLTVSYTGLPGAPDLVCEFRVYDNQPWGDIRVIVRNATSQPIELHDIRVVKSDGGEVVQLNGPASADRVLSDNFTENPVQLMDLGEPKDGVHLGFGSQLIYNRKSGQSLFFGALSADRLLTRFHLLSTTGPDAHLLSYDVSDSGTGTAIGDESQGFESGHPDPFRLQAAAGASIASERLMFAIGSDYDAQPRTQDFFELLAPVVLAACCVFRIARIAVVAGFGGVLDIEDPGEVRVGLRRLRDGQWTNSYDWADSHLWPPIGLSLLPAEQIRNQCGPFEYLEGWLFRKKWPLPCEASVYCDSQSALSAKRQETSALRNYVLFQYRLPGFRTCGIKSFNRHRRRSDRTGLATLGPCWMNWSFAAAPRLPLKNSSSI